MKSTIMSRRDLDFLLFEWLAVDDLVKRERFAEHSRETFSDVLDLCEELATRYFAPHNKKSDQNEPSFDGTTVTVLDDWRRRPHRSDLQEMYERACGIFTTTLGPDADRYHQDHFHFDRARHRNGGSYCP